MNLNPRVVLPLAGLLAAAALHREAPGAVTASAVVSTAQTSPPYTYTVLVRNTGTTNIGTFWFAWTATPRSYDFLPTQPTNISGPAGWISPVTHNAFPGDGYGVEWYDLSNSPIPPGGTGLFRFTSNDSPSALTGNAFFPPFRITNSVVYIGFPQTDPGYAFVASVRACIADFDDGTGQGHPDGGVTIDDLLYYLGLFGQGDAAADIDDGSGHGTPDGGVTIDDLLYYLARYGAGC